MCRVPACAECRARSPMIAEPPDPPRVGPITAPGPSRSKGLAAPETPASESMPLRPVRPILSRLEIEPGPAQIVAGLGLAGIAILAGSLLAPVLGDTVPFLLYFPAVVIAASIGGHRTGIVTVAACAVGQAVAFQ